ncbi:MAG: hypothetical protein Q7S61_06110, partial [bacterium]|nr:hypothetical protein [bacterium]
MNAWLITLLFISEILVLYAVSRVSTSFIFYVFKKVTKSTDISFALLTFIFSPGTVLHELSHFLMATILFLRVREFNLLPVWKGNHIKLGSVVYEKKDLIRGIIVGIVPIWTGIGALAILAYYLHGGEVSAGLKILLWYLVFVISSTMFSSQQDLKDVIYILPLLIIF